MRRELPALLPPAAPHAVSPIPVISPEKFESLEADDAAVLLRERFRGLLRLGHNVEAAVIIGVHPEVDVREATSLTLRGCPAETAVRILR